MEQGIHIYVDLYGEAQPVGRLWAHRGGRRESASFEYEKRWLENPRRFADATILKHGIVRRDVDECSGLVGLAAGVRQQPGES
jgi:hypothetical protein